MPLRNSQDLQSSNEDGAQNKLDEGGGQQPRLFRDVP